MTNPECPRPGHEAGTVSRDGIQDRGGRKRQRWRCTMPDQTFHRFMGAVSRTRLDDHDGAALTCVSCDSAVSPHQGPATPWRFDYLIEEVADALVALGNGGSYTEVSEHARAHAWKAGRSPKRGTNTTVNGQLAANWLARFGPVVTAGHLETSWPDTLVLDSTKFTYQDTWTGRRKQLFTVLAAYGYPTGEERGRLWALVASPTDDGPAWRDFLKTLPGKPRVVILDDDKGIQSGVRLRWPGRHTPALHQCEHHLYANARRAMDRDWLPDIHPLHDLLNVAFTSPAAWAAFEDAVNRSRRRELQAWVARWSPRLRAQLLRRASHPPDMPGHWANGAVEHSLQVTRRVIGNRAWTLRNRARANLLLTLVRLRVNKADSSRAYEAAIRTHLLDHRGHPAVTDPVADQDVAGVRTYSLRR